MGSSQSDTCTRIPLTRQLTDHTSSFNVLILGGSGCFAVGRYQQVLNVIKMPDLPKVGVEAAVIATVPAIAIEVKLKEGSIGNHHAPSAIAP